MQPRSERRVKNNIRLIGPNEEKLIIENQSKHKHLYRENSLLNMNCVNQSTITTAYIMLKSPLNPRNPTNFDSYHKEV